MNHIWAIEVGKSLTSSVGRLDSEPGEVEVEGRRVTLSNLDRILYPQAGFTKADLINYYIRIAPALLPHLSSRPLTLRRFPDGVDQPGFWQKRCPESRPEWIRTEGIWSEHAGESIDYCVVDDLPGLIWVANQSGVELHVPLGSGSESGFPSAVVFDLDPGAPANLLDCCEVALLLKEALDQLGLSSWIKSSGSKGLQMYVPLNSETSYKQSKAFAHAIALLFEQREPDRIVSRMTKSVRHGKVLIDWSQNDPHKTTVCAYSMRATASPRVSRPLSWAEVETAAGSDEPDNLQLGPDESVERFNREGDLFEAVLHRSQHLPE